MNTTSPSPLNPPWEGGQLDDHQLFPNLTDQDSDVRLVGGGADLLSVEARHGCAGIWLRGLHHLLQVISPNSHLEFPLSQFVKSWTSMEHDGNWVPKVNILNFKYQTHCFLVRG